MRTTKALLLAAVLAAASLANSMAQTVYSVNVVGFVNLELTNTPPNGGPLFLISNPLQGTNNDLATVLPSVPDGTSIQKWDTNLQQFETAISFDSGIFGGWELPATQIRPGEAFFISMGAPATVTFVGEVRQGPLVTPVVAGYAFVASQVPQQGGITSVLGYAATDGDGAQTWNVQTQQFNTQVSYDSGIFGGWETEPVLAVGEGIVLVTAVPGGAAWSRTFNVNP